MQSSPVPPVPIRNFLKCRDLNHKPQALPGQAHRPPSAAALWEGLPMLRSSHA